MIGTNSIRLIRVDGDDMFWFFSRMLTHVILRNVGLILHPLFRSKNSHVIPKWGFAVYY